MRKVKKGCEDVDCARPQVYARYRTLVDAYLCEDCYQAAKDASVERLREALGFVGQQDPARLTRAMEGRKA